eukprot:2708656-Pleurochrysis_carterae.AAC.4
MTPKSRDDQLRAPHFKRRQTCKDRLSWASSAGGVSCRLASVAIRPTVHASASRGLRWTLA